jgi:hypothetical protein
MLLPINAEKACDKVQHSFLIKKKKNSYQQKLHQKIHKHLETEQDVAA